MVLVARRLVVSVINQMLKDLDKQQGKKGPAVVSQRPSFPRPAPGNSRKFLLIGLALAAVGLWFGIKAPISLPALFSSANTEPAIAAVATTAPTQTTQTTAPQAAKPEAVVLPVTTQSVTNTQNAADPRSVTGPQTATSTQGTAETTTAVAPQPLAQQQYQADPDNTTAVEPQQPAPEQVSLTTAENTTAATTQINTTASATVWQAETTAGSNSYPAAQPAEFADESTAAQQSGPSSMQVEQVAFDITTQLQRLKTQATAALGNGHYQDLQQKAQQYIQLAPDDVQGYEWLSESYRQLQQWQALQQLLQLCQQLDLGSDLLLLQQGRLASQLKNWPQAEQALLQISPGFETLEVLQLKANVLQQQQKLQQALLAWQQLTSLQPGFGRGWLGQALVLDQQGQKQQAKQAYQQALTAGGLSAATVQFIQQRLVQAE